MSKGRWLRNGSGKWMKRLLWSAAILVLVLLGLPFMLFPVLAKNAPTGSATVVVEGWIPQQRSEDILDLIKAKRYDRIFTTGTVREATYYLKKGDTLDFHFTTPVSGRMNANIAGLDGARCVILADEDTVMDHLATSANIQHYANIRTPCTRIRVQSFNPNTVPEDMSNVYLMHLLVDRRNVHETQRSVVIHRADSTTVPGRPDHATALAIYLTNSGVDPDRITAIPTTLIAGGRTWSNAMAFAQRAKRDGITEVDVMSQGVHARRSHVMYQKACGPNIRVGVIDLPDPGMDRTNWWKHVNGWSTVYKEMAGLFAVHFIGHDQEIN